MITLGGNAELELVDSMDPFSEGIIFSVMPPKKSWKNISNLSGGEKVSWPIFSSPLSADGQSFSRHSVPLLWCSLYMSSRWVCIPESFVSGTYFPISPLRFTSWTKSTRLLTLEMFRLLRTTSKTELRTHNLSSFLWGMAPPHRFWKPILNKSDARNDMFELANRLIGIYKTSNATQSTFCLTISSGPS